MLVLGTSGIVHPAAGLPLVASRAGAKIAEINIDPTPLTPLADYVFTGKAGEVLPALDLRLRERIAS
jgi:NAD-dependent SIR2 family protein deacetylase